MEPVGQITQRTEELHVCVHVFRTHKFLPVVLCNRNTGAEVGPLVLQAVAVSNSSCQLGLTTGVSNDRSLFI